MTGRLILVVEDTWASAKLLIDVLPFHGFRVTHAKDGDEALRLAADEPPAVVLMDIHLPRLNGIEAMQRMRTMPALAATKFVALTASVMPQDQESFTIAGFDAIHGKPIDMQLLIGQIEGMLGGSAHQ